jgi:hypothetical protein
MMQDMMKAYLAAIAGAAGFSTWKLIQSSSGGVSWSPLWIQIKPRAVSQLCIDP